MQKQFNALEKLRRLKRVAKYSAYRMARNLKVVSPKDASKEATKDAPEDASYRNVIIIREPNTSHSLTDGYIPELDLEDIQRKVEDTQRKIKDTLEKVRLTLEETPEHAPEVAPTESAPEHAPEVAPTESAPEHAPEVAPTEETSEHTSEVAPTEETSEHTSEVAPTESAPEHAPEVAPTEETSEHTSEVAQESEIKDNLEKSRTTLELRSEETPPKKERKKRKTKKEKEEEDKRRKEEEEERRKKLERRKELEEERRKELEKKELFIKNIKAGLVDVDENVLMSQIDGKYYMIKTSWSEYYYPNLAREISKVAFDTFATKRNNLNEYESLDGAINMIKKDKKYEVQIDYDTYIINSKKEADRIIRLIKKFPEDSSMAIEYTKSKFSPTTASNLDKAYRVTLKRNPVNTSVIGSGVVGGGIYGGIKLFGDKDKDLDDEKPKTSFDSDDLSNNQQDSSDKKDAIEELMKNLNLDSENNDTIKF